MYVYMLNVHVCMPISVCVYVCLAVTVITITVTAKTIHTLIKYL